MATESEKSYQSAIAVAPSIPTISGTKLSQSSKQLIGSDIQRRLNRDIRLAQATLDYKGYLSKRLEAEAQALKAVEEPIKKYVENLEKSGLPEDTIVRLARQFSNVAGGFASTSIEEDYPLQGVALATSLTARDATTAMGAPPSMRVRRAPARRKQVRKRRAKKAK